MGRAATRGITFGLVVLLTLQGVAMAASSTEDAPRVRAPDFTGADAWLNTDGDKPLSIKDLKGQVVLLDFWTYCCINCMHVFPNLHYLEQKYKGQPVVVIGVHSGKFDQEKDADHIRQAILRHNITHPVAVDSEYKIWNAYGVQAWPTLILIDPDGYAVAGWSGEGKRDRIDQKISQLLQEGRAKGTLAKPMHFRAERDSFKSGVLEFPGKVLADSASSRLFISDTTHNRVLVSDLSGKVAKIIGSGATGSKGGSFSQAEFHQPQGLALSADGKTLFIADTENHALRAADLERGTVTTIAGTGQQARQFPDNSIAKTTPLTSPWDLARVGTKLYIAMAGIHQIWVMDLATARISIFAGTGREGAVDGNNLEAGFAQPSGLATDGSHLAVADSESSSIRSVDLTPEGQTRTIAGSGQLFGFGRRDGEGRQATFQHPLGVALSGGTLYVADTFNNLIRKIDLKTGTVTTWLGSGATDAGSDAAPNLYEPGGLSVAGSTLYVADTNHHRILAVDVATKKARVLKIDLP
ncbi:MAG TPA: thioredoxin-like domain-containing protein [Tepidisphaeraceae bacterium]|nr:thioredoxin-like domain-containing protein [Tepidisphaeraceae bacterium]